MYLIEKARCWSRSICLIYFMNACRACSNLDLISTSGFPFSQTMVPRYLNAEILSMISPSTCIVANFGSYLLTMSSLVLPKFIFRSASRPPRLSAGHAYCPQLIRCHPHNEYYTARPFILMSIWMSSRASEKTCSTYKLKIIGERIHPWCTPFLISNSSVSL